MNDQLIDKNNSEYIIDNLSQQFSKHHNAEVINTLEKGNASVVIKNENENNDSTDNDIMFVDETNKAQINVNIIKDEPVNEDEANTERNEVQANAISIVSDVKIETLSPQPSNNPINNEDISVNAIDLISSVEVSQNNESINIYKQNQCSCCKIYFDDEEYSAHFKSCNEKNSKSKSTNKTRQEDSNTKASSPLTLDLHSTLDIEVKCESENGANSTGNGQTPSSKPRKKRKSKRAMPDYQDIMPCNICDTIFNSNLDFALHSIVHSNEKKYHCFMCDYKNESLYDFKLHVRDHEKNKYKCEICKEEFSDKTEADEHKYLHTGETPFECETCGKSFMFSWLLNSHRRVKHWEVLIGTPIPKYDPNAIHYKHHVYTTLDIKRHKYYKGANSAPAEREGNVLCEVCGKRLSSMERLKFHLRVHTGYKPFVCSFCAKPFSRREQLREHERVHTGERPYICRFCGKGFTQRSPLRIHERMHTGERPYQCRLCSKGYVSKGAVDIHMKTCKGIQ